MPPIASLGRLEAISDVKRRQLGSRPESDGASKRVNWRGRRCRKYGRQYSFKHYRLARMNSPGVEEPGMLHNDFTATWETLFVLLLRSMATNRSQGRMSNDEQGVGSSRITDETE